MVRRRTAAHIYSARQGVGGTVLISERRCCELKLRVMRGRAAAVRLQIVRVFGPQAAWVQQRRSNRLNTPTRDRYIFVAPI